MTIEGVVIADRVPGSHAHGGLVDGERKMKLAAVIIVAMVADLLTFSLAIGKVGIEAEMNPVMAQAYASFGLAKIGRASCRERV